jgi:hypothetical protein
MEEPMPIDPIRARETTTWQDGYQAGRAAALAEVHSTRAKIEQLSVRPSEVIKVGSMYVVGREAVSDLLASPDEGHWAAAGTVVFEHSYLRREAGDGSGA